MKQLSLEGFELDIEINPENKKDITDCAIFFEGEGQRIIDLNRTSEFLASMEKGKLSQFGKQLSMHIAALSPLAIDKENLDKNILQKIMKTLKEKIFFLRKILKKKFIYQVKITL